MSREFRNRASRDLPARISEYLNLGGLWNPELMDHDEVRTMLIDARDVIEIAIRREDQRQMTDIMKLVGILEARAKWLEHEMNHGGDLTYLGTRREETLYVLAKIAMLSPTPTSKGVE